MNYYVLERKTGKEVLVTPDVAHEYRNAKDFIRLNKPAPQNTPPETKIVPPEATRVGRKNKVNVERKEAATKKSTKKRAAKKTA